MRRRGPAGEEIPGNGLDGVSCSPSGNLCAAVGTAGSAPTTTCVLTSTDGGHTFVQRTTSTFAGSPATIPSLSAVTCPSSTVCYALGAGRSVFVSGDGGATWTNQSASVPRLRAPSRSSRA